MPTAVRPEVGEKLVLELTAWGRLGEAMGCHDGRDVFVFGGIPGERVVAEVVDIRRRRLAARVVEVLGTVAAPGGTALAPISATAPAASGSISATAASWRPNARKWSTRCSEWEGSAIPPSPS